MTTAVETRRVPPLGGFSPSFLRLEIRRLLRNRRTMFFTLVMPPAFFLLLGGLGGVRMPGHVWVISALVAWIGAIVNVAFWTALFAAGAVWRFRRDTARV
jgi:hypothetical protein